MIEPKDILEVSSCLFDQEGEAYTRSAVSRCYYSALHEAKLHTEDVEVEGSASMGSHVLVERKVAKKFSKEQASLLRRMKKSRNRADYELWRNFSRDNMSRMLENREQLLKGLVLEDN